MYLLCLLSSVTFAVQANDFDNVEIKIIKAHANVYMLKGAGGNIGVLSTKDGMLLVDDEFAPLAKRIEVALNTISDKKLKYIVNTHFHGDHTGSNTFFALQAPIFANQNVRKRLLAKAPDKRVALPVVTFDHGMNIYFGGETIQLTHYAHAHTDGDSVVYFKKANVLHTGDLFFELGFPYIDLKHGGSVKGYLAAVKQIIKSVPDDVVIIPGHGKLTNKARYQAFANMIDYSVNRVSQLLAQGKTAQQIYAIGLDQKYKKWSWKFITEKKWLKTLVADLK